MKKPITLATVLMSTSAFAGFVPDYCDVESWCLVKATDCFVGHFSTRPSTYVQAHSQYSVVRKATALCRIRNSYGDVTIQRMQFTSPVEPVKFTGNAFKTEEEAADYALNLCSRYRADWVAAAPVCQ